MNKNFKQSASSTPADFDEVVITLASPEDIANWSFGEVTKPETINYRTQRSERGGLFDEKIFGPDKDYECYCGKYRGIRYKGIVCEKCGVELTRAIVRRERMGHIDLAVPVSHIWFLKGVPSRIALTLGLSQQELERVIYFAGYIVTYVNDGERQNLLRDLDREYRTKMKDMKDEKDSDELKELFTTTKREIENLREGQVLDEASYHRYSMRYSAMFEAGIGAEAIYNIFQGLDLKTLADELEDGYEKAGAGERLRISKRLSVLRAMIHGNIRPDWMFLTRLPVTPPALRPMVALEGGRHATSDLNDLYRRVINRNNRLKKLKDIKAPDVILRNEKRILQEAVDALIDNTMRGPSGSAMSKSQRRPLKSLADSLKGKQGLFRANLLGKRVDYSGRSVIVVGPELRLHQCGLPKHMALELFRPFVIAQLLEQELAYNIRGANRLIDEGIPEVWAILEEVIKDKYVMLNRAPTLHRLGIQAFQPVLIEGNAIRVHPLVCTAFNADFDGDQMAVHVPLSKEAEMEAKHIMLADKNLLKPSTGDAIISLDRLDMVLGCFWVTKIVKGEKGEGKMFADPNSAIMASDFGEVGLRAKIKVMATASEKYADLKGTENESVEELKGGKVFETSVGRLLFNSILPSDYSFINTAIDRKAMSNIVHTLLEKYSREDVPATLDKIKAFGFNYATRAGITWSLGDIVIPEEKKNLISEAQKEAQLINTQYSEGLLSETERYRKSIELWYSTKDEIEKLIPSALSEDSSVFDMWKSGARGSLAQITQMAGLKGLVSSTQGVVEFPIISSLQEGLTPLEYFISTHGSRKGLTDTALNTAKAGYLTRRLFDVAQDVIISSEKCNADKGLTVYKGEPSGIDIPLSKHTRGRFASADIVSPEGEKIILKDEFITNRLAETIDQAEVKSAEVYSPLTCNQRQGICARCYGMDLGTGDIVAVGEAVGTVAAQAIGEPATQLTMRTFHAGGAATVGGDITQGLPRVEEVFERRLPKNPAVICRIDGEVTEIREQGREKTIVVLPDPSSVKKGGKKESVEYAAHYLRVPVVSLGEKVKKGSLLTDGSVDINELYKYGGRQAAERYIINETNRIYELQGASVSRKHIEVIVRQMFARVKVKNQGDSHYVSGDVLERAVFEDENEALESDGKLPIEAESMVLGITDVSLSRQSFLSAASFQWTTKVLIRSAIKGSVDQLKGLKENIIIGRLMPAGSGFEGSEKNKMVKGLAQEAIAAEVDPVEEVREEEE